MKYQRLALKNSTFRHMVEMRNFFYREQSFAISFKNLKQVFGYDRLGKKWTETISGF